MSIYCYYGFVNFIFIVHHISCFSFFFFNDTATTEIYTLSLHDALPIFPFFPWREGRRLLGGVAPTWLVRSEEHTSELQSPCNLVCRLLLEKKKKNNRYIPSRLIKNDLLSNSILHPVSTPFGAYCRCLLY